MDSNWVQGRRYRLVLRGELGDPFGFLFDGMRLQRLAGMTVLTGQVTDQAHLLGLIEQIQELGVELVSVNPDQETGGAAGPGMEPGAERPLPGGRPGVIARIRASLPAALHGPHEHSYAGAQKCEVGEHLDDEHDPGGL